MSLVKTMDGTRGHIVILLLAIFFVLLCPDTVRAQLEGQPRGHGSVFVPRDRYTLNGQLSLVYDRSWGTNREAVDNFSYQLQMNLHGFVVDPRLMTFGLSGTFGQSFKSDASSTFDGLGAWVSLLNDRPRRGLLKYFPSPIMLRYSYYSFEGGDRQLYGISMAYRFDEKGPAPRKRGFTNNSDDKEDTWKEFFALRHLPQLYFDYNRSEYHTDTYSSVYDRLTLRAVAHAEHLDYYAVYEYDKESSKNNETTGQLFEFVANYKNNWKESETRLESFNKLTIEDRDLGDKASRFYSYTTWLKNFGKEWRDSIYVSGGGNYISLDRGSLYSLNLSSGYSIKFTERFDNQSSADMVYGKGDIDTFQGESAKSNFQYRLTDRLTLIGNVEVGKLESATSYSAGIGVAARGRISFFPRYTYSSTSGDEINSVTQHTLYLDASGPLPLLRRVYFSSQNYYKITDTDSPLFPTKVKTLYLSANLNWSISRYIFTLSGGYSRTSLDDQGFGSAPIQQNGKDEVKTITASMSTFFSRRLSLNVAGSVFKHNDEPAEYHLTSYLTWQWRLVAVTAKYDMYMHGGSTTDHRLYVRVTRSIQGAIRPFLGGVR